MTIFLGDQAVTSQLFERTEELGGLPAEGPGLGLTLYDVSNLIFRLKKGQHSCQRNQRYSKLNWHQGCQSTIAIVADVNN